MFHHRYLQMIFITLSIELSALSRRFAPNHMEKYENNHNEHP
jgi:hypothetical protein